jgi:hypothetical protein
MKCVIENTRESERGKLPFDIELNHDINVWIRWTLELEKIYILSFEDIYKDNKNKP